MGLLLLAGAVFLALIILDEWMRVNYILKARKHNAALPHIRMSRPFGLPNLKRMICAARDNKSIESGLSIYGITGKRTFLMQFSFDMEFHTKDPDNIKAMLATQFKDFDLGLREKSLGYFLGKGVFTLSGQGWKHSRAMLRPQFTRELVAQLESVDTHVQTAIGVIKRECEAHGRINFQQVLHQLTMDTATEFLFGSSTNTLLDGTRKYNGISSAQFVRDYKLGVKYSLIRFTLGPLYWLFKPKPFREAIERCRRYVDYFVQRALDETKDNKPRHLDHDKQQTNQASAKENTTKAGYTFSIELAKVTRDPVIIRDQLFNILVAGHDTTGNLLGYTVWYLGHYPETWAKLRESILELYPTKEAPITFENIKKCTFLAHVLNEVLRLHPIVPRNLRFAVRDTWLPRGGGPNESQPIFVPRGSAVSYHVFGLQRDKQLWGSDADEFRPERWQHPTVGAWCYIPFNGGPRICLGQQFALTEASVTIIRLAQNFSRFDLEDKLARQPDNQAELTSQVAGGVWGNIEPA